MKLFPTNPVLYTYMFPWLWYPLKNIVMTWTIFLTMGLSTERYLAVCRPILYRTLGSVTPSLGANYSLQLILNQNCIFSQGGLFQNDLLSSGCLEAFKYKNVLCSGS